jgi:hypothetical protein
VYCGYGGVVFKLVRDWERQASSADMLAFVLARGLDKDETAERDFERTAKYYTVVSNAKIVDADEIAREKGLKEYGTDVVYIVAL